eukprot:CAMPEP_0196193616 /NCGR_PEP_ID=MMETSP0911-20130528/49633_1 /TAXON_ID=49265 /ORGANISM="Thalassiosira rotula, Strain GSO102" /LENGTH=115 /DNA_ID=CAMNT_0041465857 /DNA_START=543 /DNA_END=887 /DNA_ORIENTATION=-
MDSSLTSGASSTPTAAFSPGASSLPGTSSFPGASFSLGDWDSFTPGASALAISIFILGSGLGAFAPSAPGVGSQGFAFRGCSSFRIISEAMVPAPDPGGSLGFTISVVVVRVKAD